MIHPFISGNKWRKLKYILELAKVERQSHLVTFGGPYSNHLLATACAAAKFGFRSTGIVRGEEVHNDVLMLSKLFGMNLIFAGRSEYRDKNALFEKYFVSDPDALFIDEGGAGELGVKGCSELVNELAQTYDHLFCSAGTGTTAAGIVKGVNANFLNTKIHVVPVVKNGSFLRQEIGKYTDHPFEMHTDFHFGGYAKTTPELLSFIRKFCSSTGILIEPVYTGKMFAALFDLIERDFFPSGSKILAVHTGGLTGILGMSSKLK